MSMIQTHPTRTLQKIAILTAAAATAYSFGVCFRYSVSSIEAAARSASFTLGIGISAYALSELEKYDDETPLRESQRSVANEINAVIATAKAEWYAGNLDRALRGDEPSTEFITAYLRSEFGIGADGSLIDQTAPVNAPDSTQPELDYFDWDDLALCDRHPHILILAGSGCGKTTLMEWIARRLGGNIEVWTTKRKDSQWAGLPTFGVGRDFDAISERYTLAIAELTRRCKNLDAVTKPTLIVWDEISAAVAANPNLSPSPILREGREALIRLIASPHGGQVSSIGLVGQSDVISSATLIRLGGLAIDHAKRLLKAGDLSELEWQALRESDRPCLVGNKVAIVPYLEDGWQLKTPAVLEVVDQNESALYELLSQCDRPMSVRDIMRTSVGRKTGLKADEIRTILENTPGLQTSQVNGTTKYAVPVTVITS